MQSKDKDASNHLHIGHERAGEVTKKCLARRMRGNFVRPALSSSPATDAQQQILLVEQATRICKFSVRSLDSCR
jgi:hypothetical protein